MKTTVTLTDENASGLAWAVELTGLSLEEIVNLLLADELTCFRPDDDWNEYVEKTFVAAGNLRIEQALSER